MATTCDTQATLESLLGQATDPNNEEDRWDCIKGFYELVNREAEGPQVAVRLLSHKIQSPQEKEALQALTVLEACMNNCGKGFHREVAKFRFLNELIKLLTPKYFGAWTPQKVKDRVTEVLYGWTLWLKEEPKIQEAYSMLKKQGIVKKDPKLPDMVIMAPPPQRTTQSVFDQEDKAQLLARLLKSPRAEDLETANRLIKNTLREEQEKAEKVSKRESTLKEVESSTKRLREVLEHQAAPSDEVKTLYERCDRLRPTLYRLASDTMEDDAALVQILAANDELTLAVNAYKERVARSEGPTEDKSDAPRSPREIKSYHLIDLSALDSPPPHREAESPSPAGSSILEGDPDSGESGPTAFERHDLFSKQAGKTSRSYYDELLQLNGDFQVTNGEQNGGRGHVLRSRGCRDDGGVTSNGTSVRSRPHNQPAAESQEDVSPPSQDLKSIFVPVGTIRSSHLEPIAVFDQGGIHVSLHFAKDFPPGRPDVAVVVVSSVNTSALRVKDFLFQAAVPKTMLVKLQPASGTQLPPYNPLLPPPAISQVLLLANPHKRKVRLRYRLTLTHGDKLVNETREIADFPDWTNLITH